MNTNKLFVGNLPFSSTDQILNDLFSDCGTVESAKVITDRDTGRAKGFGFVEMSSTDEAAAAIEKLNGAEVEGRAIVVSEAKPKSDSRGGSGGGGGGRGGSRNRW